MSRYFFDTVDGSRCRDTQGTELPDIQAALREAVVFAGAEIKDNPKLLGPGQDFRVEVTNDRGLLLFSVVTLVLDAPAAARV